MAIAKVASAGARSANNNDVTTGAIDTTGANLLVAVCAFLGSVTLSDSKSNTWTPLTIQTATGLASAQLFYVESPSVGAGHTFTLSGTGTFPGLGVIAFSGAKASGAFDQQNGAATTSGVQTFQPGSVTPSENDEALVANIAHGGIVASVAIDSSFTLDINLNATANSYGVHLAYKIQTSAGAENPTWTWTGANGVAAPIATFKVDAGGGPTFYYKPYGLSSLGVQ